MHVQQLTGPDGPAPDDARRPRADAEYELIALRSPRRLRPVTDDEIAPFPDGTTARRPAA